MSTYDVIEFGTSKKLTLREQLAGLGSVPVRRPERVQAAALAGLEGDTICFGGDCHDGDAAVRQMLSTFNSFKPTATAEFLNQFEVQVNDIRQQAEGVGFFARFFIVAQGCCQMKEIGLRAIQLTKAMFAARNLAAPVTPPISRNSAIENLFYMVLPFVLIGGGIYFFGPAIREWTKGLASKKSVSGLDQAFKLPKRKTVQKLLPKSSFDKRSFRWIKSGDARILIGCPKGKWAPRKQRCKVGTRAYEIVRPK